MERIVGILPRKIGAAAGIRREGELEPARDDFAAQTRLGLGAG
jgi:hypothetical protein